MVVLSGLERLRRWREEDRGVPPAFGRLGARLEDVAPCTTSVRLPLTPELLLPDGRPSGAVTSLLADFALTTSVIASLPDLRGVTTVALTVDHLALPPTSGSLVSRCTATAYADGRPQHAAGALHDDAGRQVAAVSGWFLAAPAEAASAERVGLAHEPPAAHLLALLGVPGGPGFALGARDALSNALGTLHGGIGALAGGARPPPPPPAPRGAGPPPPAGGGPPPAAGAAAVHRDTSEPDAGGRARWSTVSATVVTPRRSGSEAMTEVVRAKSASSEVTAPLGDPSGSSSSGVSGSRTAVVHGPTSSRRAPSRPNAGGTPRSSSRHRRRRSSPLRTTSRSGRAARGPGRAARSHPRRGPGRRTPSPTRRR